jgi:hypothetical protein
MMDRTRFRWIPAEWPPEVVGGPWEGRYWYLMEGDQQRGYVIKYTSFDTETNSITWSRNPFEVKSHKTFKEAAEQVEKDVCELTK